MPHMEFKGSTASTPTTSPSLTVRSSRTPSAPSLRWASTTTSSTATTSPPQVPLPALRRARQLRLHRSPYNTGNEKWVYNDNVNSPYMGEWLRANGPSTAKNLERHDKGSA